MAKLTRIRLCLALIILAAVLGVGGISPQNAEAAACCEDCQSGYDDCLALGGTDCWSEWRSCFYHCVFCY